MGQLLLVGYIEQNDFFISLKWRKISFELIKKLRKKILFFSGRISKT